ncbi:putative pachytene checkpoint component Pch2 [Aspergillus tanneri]|uniref:Uncharacterized protein n=1 Tax=Aspergillus tanneri TaxID=1220188 RepID=A0A5M9MGP0_9EURO|nr:uncharacterized protein ATNIH1004_010428 [Aspergillus tanneri]KAA8643659.1 hypothetical protein ATNIH1004_010428 [Aspergillus tanneri]
MDTASCVSCPDITHQPVLHVEARVKSNGDGIIIRTDLVREEVTKWLVDNFAVLSLGQKISSFEHLHEPHAQYIDSILVTECTGGEVESGAYRLQHVELDVQAYQLHTPFEQESSQNTLHSEEAPDSSEDTPRAQVMTLPSKELDGLWESLQFDEPLQSTLLRAITRMVSFSSRKLNKWTINWNRLVLLWGPPGTGKTSFWHVKLAIRLGKQYPRSKLVEINVHSLGSRFFSESGKLVSKAIESVEILLEEEEDTFVYVFVDEVETLAARRERALAGSEPFDAVRAVNALLTGLDRLKHHCNVIVVCTSNLITALDQAFLDRVDIKQFIPHLSNRTIYGVYKECLEELSRCGIIGGASFDVVQVNPDDPFTALQYVESPTENLTIPSFDEMLLNYQMFADAVPKQLADAACESVGLSGRTIRRLPAMSLVMYGPSRVRYDVRTAIQALRTGIGSERKAKVEAQ